MDPLKTKKDVQKDQIKSMPKEDQINDILSNYK
jgi:hypothetical protein